MSTAREPILAAFVALLASIPGINVARSRDAAIARSEVPYVVIQPEEEAVEFPAAGIAHRRLTILFTVLIRAEPPDQAADPWIQAIHSKIMQDPTIGGIVGRTVERGTKWAIETGDVTGLAADVRYEVIFATAAGDLSVRY